MRSTFALLACALAGPAWAAPEDRGPHPFTDYSAGRVSLAGVDIPVRVYHPSDAAAPGPVVAVVHGFLRNGTFMAELARALASRGMVALVPDMPCGLSGCDHAANADQIRALLAWGVAEGARGGGALAGRVDGARRGVIGHSWGALATLLASAQAGGFEVAVLLDPNDDRDEGATVAPRVDKPVLLLQAEVLGSCNSAWGSGTFATIPPPHLRARIRGAAHCDAEEPSDSLCPIGCGRGDPAKSAVFRRYAVAFVACALAADRAMAPWVGGAELAMDDADGVVDMVSAAGLDALACRGGVVPPPADAGAVSPEGDAAARDEDAAEGRDSDGADAAVARADASDAPAGDAAPATLDAAPIGGRADAGTGALVPLDDGCATTGARAPSLVVIALLIAGRRARRRRAHAQRNDSITAASS